MNDLSGNTARSVHRASPHERYPTSMKLVSGMPFSVQPLYYLCLRILSGRADLRSHVGALLAAPKFGCGSAAL